MALEGPFEPLRWPDGEPPTLLVVVDTEEEFDWSAPFDAKAVSTKNIECQLLAQEILDRYGVKPTYVIDYPVADNPDATAILRTLWEERRCEIGAHLHPWVNPPHECPVDEYHSYPGNLPRDLERRKLARLVDRIEQAFGFRPWIYKAGRYGVGPWTWKTLSELGFTVDVSVVPETDFSPVLGPDFSKFSAVPLRDNNGIVLLPLSVHFLGALSRHGVRLNRALSRGAYRKLRILGILSRLGLLRRARLSPESDGLSSMMRQTRAALRRGERLFMLTYHSSTLLPGATHYVKDDNDRRLFLKRLDDFVGFFYEKCHGQSRSVTEAARVLHGRKGGIVMSDRPVDMNLHLRSVGRSH